MSTKWNADWPILKKYNKDKLRRIALPLGGMGTGTVSLGGRGDLRDWELMNHPSKGYVPHFGRGPAPFFAIWVKDGKNRVARTLEGPIDTEGYEASHGSRVANHGLPRFRRCEFATGYPFGQVALQDKDVPVRVRIEAFNPLIPGDADSSGIPMASLRYVISNPTSRAMTVSISASMVNFIGEDGRGKRNRSDSLDKEQLLGNRITYRKGKAARGLFYASEGVHEHDSAWGTLALGTLMNEGVSARCAWAQLSWGDSLLDFWDDFLEDGALDTRKSNEDTPIGSLAVKIRVPARSERSIPFVLAWHFPNRKTWTPSKKNEAGCCPSGTCDNDMNRIGNWYATQYRDAWDVLQKTAKVLDDLETRTKRFVSAFCESDLPQVVKEAALFNVSTLRTETCFRTEDGVLYGWEGCGDRQGCCHGSCTHVWNYEQTSAFLFGDLSKTMRMVEFENATRENGHMAFRINLPLNGIQQTGIAAADGQMGCLMKLYRDWQLSGDDALLQRLWPKARKALEYCWIKGGWDADQDGVMEGCQHNTMDVEYYGPNPQMGTWYLGALRAMEAMATYLDEKVFAQKCGKLFKRGSEWIDKHLFNGDYYEHRIVPPQHSDAIAPGLRHKKMGAQNFKEPELQLESGCLVDQLVGQYMAHVCGLGYLTEAKKVRKTLKSILKYNRRDEFFSHFNHLRSYALGDERALLMASYPKGRRPARPFPYFNEVMTGFEHTVAAHLMYEGMSKEGERVVQDIRDRYDGCKRNPFNEAECGHHYARAMAAWAEVLAWTGFQYSALTKTMTFASSRKKVKWFWSTGYAWGMVEQKPAKQSTHVSLEVIEGKLNLKRLKIIGVGEVDVTLGKGKQLQVRVPLKI